MPIAIEAKNARIPLRQTELLSIELDSYLTMHTHGVCRHNATIRKADRGEHLRKVLSRRYWEYSSVTAIVLRVLSAIVITLSA